MPATAKKQRKTREKVKDDKVSVALKDVKAMIRQYERAMASGHMTLAISCADAIIPAIKHLRVLAERSVRSRYGNDFEIPERVSLEENTDDEDENEDELSCEECEDDCDELCSCECHDDQEDEND